MTKVLLTTGLVGAVVVLGLVATLSAEAPEESSSTTTAFRVEGMTCGGCEVAVKRAVKKIEGVDTVAASHKEASAEVTYDPAKVTPEEIVAAIEKIGFGAEAEEQEEEEPSASADTASQ